VGRYTVKLPGLGTPGPIDGSVQATAVSPNVGARCKVETWTSSPSDQVATIACYTAAGWPFEQKPDPKDKFLFYGTTAFGDYNYFEVLDLEKVLLKLGVTHHVELFEGVHQWMPAELATRALAWIELQAMKAGSRAKEAGWIEAQWQETLARARGYEAAGDLFLAEREYRAAAADFAALREIAPAAAKAAEIQALPAFQKDAREREKVEKAEKAYLERARGVIALISPENGPATAAQIAGSLQIADLKKRAKSSENIHDRWSAKRLLATLHGQTASYLPTNFMAKKEYDRAILALSIALEINESNTYALVTRAKAHSLKGDRKRALADLEQAAEKGWKDADAVEGEGAFGPLRGDGEFQKVLARMRQAPAKAGA
jgi:tetratricopeptide (TPR) repeat protein